MCLDDIALRAQNMVSILGAIVNIIEGPIRPFNEHENVQFDNE